MVCTASKIQIPDMAQTLEVWVKGLSIFLLEVDSARSISIFCAFCRSGLKNHGGYKNRKTVFLCKIHKEQFFQHFKLLTIAITIIILYDDHCNDHYYKKAYSFPSGSKETPHRRGTDPSGKVAAAFHRRGYRCQSRHKPYHSPEYRKGFTICFYRDVSSSTGCTGLAR